MVLQLLITSLSLELTSCVTPATPSLSTPKLTYQQAEGIWAGPPLAVWQRLQPTGKAQLFAMQNRTHDGLELGWIKLALISKEPYDTAQLAKALIAWRAAYPGHPGNQLFTNDATLKQLTQLQLPLKIALLLPTTGNYSGAARSVRAGFLNKYYRMHSAQQEIRFYNTQQTSLLNIYNKAVAQGASIVVGPLIKEDVTELQKNTNFSVPVLALNYTDKDHHLPANFYEFGLLPEDEVQQMAVSARAADLHNALIIAPQTEWGQRLVETFTCYWTMLGGHVVDHWYFTKRVNFNQEIAHLLQVNLKEDRMLMRKANDKTLLVQQRRQDFDSIFLFSSPQDARLIVPLLRYYYVERDIPIYATSSVYFSNINYAKDNDLRGIVICDIPHASRQTARADERLFAVGQDAFVLSQSLTRLIALPYFPLYGETGALVLSKQQVHRRLPCKII